jgi:hypothetical protein
MSRSFVRASGAALVVSILALVAVGCGPAVHNIAVRSSASVAPDPGSATIVVMQPSTRYGSVSILDPSGNLVGMLNDRSATIVHVPAGNFRLYALVEREAGWGDRLEGTVEAGRVYYATISMRWGGINFLALNPRSRDDRWSHLSEYLDQSPMVEMSPSGIPVATRELGDTQAMIQRIDHFADGLDADHHEERVVQAADGQ